MIYLSCDYHYGAHPLIMQRMTDTLDEANVGYGEDSHCNKAASLIREACKAPEAAVHFLVGGTQTNTTIIAAALRPYQGVLTADTGHINVHETGAIEATGHKVLALPSHNGKITGEQIHQAYLKHVNDGSFEHIVMPKMVYISNSTELGSIYTKKELEDIGKVCKQDGLYLFMDGARLGYALTSPENDLDLPTIAKWCDVFYIGGTKCGAMFGEAVVVTNKELNQDFRYMIKQRGGMLAKGWLLGIQFETLFTDNLYFNICKQAVEQAMVIKDTLKQCGVKFQADSPTNQQFVYMDHKVLDQLAEKYVFSDDEKALGNDVRPVRFCTSWATTWEEINMLVEDIKNLCGK